MTEGRLTVAIIATMLNEEKSVRGFLDSVAAQARKPDEVIITDGGSTDGTVAVIKEYIGKGHNIALEVLPKANRSKGRNRAIELAHSDIIAVTDAGCRLDPHWLTEIVEPFRAKDGVSAVAGFYRPFPEGSKEECIGSMTIPDAVAVNPDTFLPSSRSVAFTKEAWRKAGGYPENLSLNEDTPFDLRLIGAGYKFAFAPEALVYWRPRGTVSEVYRQFRSYARGDGQAGIFPGIYLSIFARYLWLAAFLAIAAIQGRWVWVLAGLISFVPRLARDIGKVRRRTKSVAALFYALPVRMAIDLGDMAGYVRGTGERLSGKVAADKP